MNDLLQIQKGLRSSRSDPSPRHGNDDELEEDELEHFTPDCFVLPVNYNLYNKGYTTKHWLSVFRGLEAGS
ncbi:hypothetical protein N8500_07505 [Candidatus Puniceispirillum sp.]|nr:hypothetical protein [Candidatus Puniceispirillum sp.]